MDDTKLMQLARRGAADLLEDINVTFPGLIDELFPRRLQAPGGGSVEITRLPAPPRRRRKKPLPRINPTTKKPYVRSPEARQNMRAAQLKRYASRAK